MFVIVLDLYGLSLRKSLEYKEIWNDWNLLIVLNGIASGMYHVHSHDIIHRDINPNNVLLKMSMDSIIQAVLSDFGLAKSFSESEIKKDENSKPIDDVNPFGTSPYIAPELYEDGIVRNTKRSDVYGFGVIMLQLVFMRHRELQTEGDIKQALKEDNMDCSTEWRQQVKKLMKQCLSEEPENRPTSQTIFEKLKEICNKELPLAESIKGNENQV